jgi:hypothetical protein
MGGGGVMAVHGPGKESGVTHKEGQKPLPRSSKGIQIESEGNLLDKIQAKQAPKLKSVPFLGKVEAYFVNQSVRKAYVKELHGVFVNQAASQAYEREGAANAFQDFLAPKLREMRLEDIPHFETFIKSHSLAYFMGAAQVPQGKKAISRVADTVIQAVKKSPKEVRRVSENFRTTKNVFGALGLNTEFEYFDIFLSQLAKERPLYDQTIGRHEELLAEAVMSDLFKQHMRQRSEEDKGALLKASFTETGHAYLMQTLRKGGSPEEIKNTLDNLIGVQKGGKLAQEAASMRSASKIMEKLSIEERHKFLEAWIKTSQEMEPSQFDDFLKKFSEHLLKVEKNRAESLDRDKDIGTSYERLKSEYPAQLQRFDFLNLR